MGNLELNMIENMADEFLDIREEKKEVWRVEDDLAADWCLDKIKESRSKYKRFEDVAKAKIQQIENVLKKEKEKMENETEFFEAKLREYFETIKDQAEETKTLKKYKLPSGELRMKKSQVTFDYDKKKLLEVAETDGNMDDYIKVKKDFDWANFKKNLKIEGNSIINKETGEIIEIEGLAIKEEPEEFSVEV